MAIRPLLLLTGSLLFLALLTALDSAASNAQSIVIDVDRHPEFVVPGSRVRPRPIPPVELRHHGVDIDIRDQVAKVRVSQVFFNRSHRPLEGTYIFPLPATATISAFSMTMNGKLVAGEILEKDKARGIYEAIVRQRKDPGLLECIGNGMIRARIFPIPANQESRIEFEYSQILEADSGLMSLRYPLRRQDGSSSNSPTVSVQIDLTSRVPLTSVFCPTHVLDKSISDPHRARLSFEGRLHRHHEDLVLYATLSQKEIGLNLITHRIPGEDGTFLMLLSPRTDLDENRTIPKDISFVLDTSGSMAGKKIEQAKEALRFALNNLGAEDRFNVIPFSTEARPFFESPRPSNPDNVASALAQVSELRPAGGTNIDDGLARGLQGLSSEGRVSMVVFLTDGLPTIGETDISRLLKNVKRNNGSRSRIFVFGVGADLNTFLLDKIAEESAGTRQYVSENENIEHKVSAFYSKVAHPILSNVSVELPGQAISDVYPKKLPDLFRGSQLVVLGRYQSHGPTSVVLRGQIGDSRREFVYEGTLPKTQPENGEIRTLWAKRKVGYLLDQIRLNGPNQELTEEIVRLGKKFGIVTPYTSALVLEDDVQLSNFVRPRDLQLGLSTQGGRRRASSTPVPGSTQARGFVGRVAVRESDDIARLKESTVSNGTELEKKAGKSSRPSLVRKGAKTFVLRNDVWLDLELSISPAPEVAKSRSTRTVVVFSKEYFDLIRERKELASFFSVGSRVKVLLGNVIYEVRPQE